MDALKETYDRGDLVRIRLISGTTNFTAAVTTVGRNPAEKPLWKMIQTGQIIAIQTGWGSDTTKKKKTCV